MAETTNLNIYTGPIVDRIYPPLFRPAIKVSKRELQSQGLKTSKQTQPVPKFLSAIPHPNLSLFWNFALMKPT